MTASRSGLGPAGAINLDSAEKEPALQPYQLEGLLEASS